MSEYPGIRRWLLACIVAVFLTVVIGGITRLTESGLSITEWKPIAGVLPPMSDAGWDEALEKFRQIPQAQTTHAGIALSEFKWIYWWEWFHRLAARAVGLIFALPFLWFAAKRRLPKGYAMRLAWLPLLTLGQGVLGWYMVSSGLEVRTEVSSYRLAAHLSLALAILVIAVWTWADLDPQRVERRAERGWRRAAFALVAMISMTVVSGAFVAGLRGGKVFNEFPLMGGQIVPPGYQTFAGWWTNAFENPIAAQFHHRVLAILTGVFAVVLALRARVAVVGEASRRAMRRLGIIVVVQVALGITTLLMSVPVVLGVAHQFVGTLALTFGVLALHRLVAPPAPGAR